MTLYITTCIDIYSLFQEKTSLEKDLAILEKQIQHIHNLRYGHIYAVRKGSST